MVTVPVRGAGALPEDYAALWELIATAPKPLTCKDLCAQLGWELLPKNTEGLRSKLKRMVEPGWPAEERPGKFTARAGGSFSDCAMSPARVTKLLRALLVLTNLENHR